MSVKAILSIIAVLFLFSLIFFYLFPSNNFNFTASGNSNFSISGNQEMQYYPNMRFPSSEVSYGISDCPLSKQNEMEYAFTIIENLTPLKFYSAENPQILVSCTERNRILDSGLLIAGEGGPTNITVAGEFNVINGGEILLIRNSDCPNPNIALHELLHVLGFKHSQNSENIMYNLTNCNQIIGDDTIDLLNKLYLIPSYPDLTFTNVSGNVDGRFLDVNMTIMNNGLADAPASKVIIYADNTVIREIELEPIEIGRGFFFSVRNIFISPITFSEITLDLETNFEEIAKDNNKIKLKIKK